MKQPAAAKSSPRKTSGVAYAGKHAKTGNSSGFRFEASLFKSHPEFSGEVRAHVIAPGRMLVVAEDIPTEREDPVVEAYLAFMAKDMEAHPENIKPLDEKRFQDAVRLTAGIEFDPDADLGDEDLLG